MKYTYKKKKKDKFMTLHVMKRFKQRFGIEIDKSVVDSMISQCKKSKSEYVMSLSKARTVHIVNVNDIKCAVVYNKEKHLIHTCFPTKWLENGSFEKNLEKYKYINS